MTDDAANEDKLRTLPSEYKRRREAGDVELGERHKQLAELMTFGLEDIDNRFPDKPIGQPLCLDDAAAVLGLRRRNARQILASPGWQKIYNRYLRLPAEDRRRPEAASRSRPSKSQLELLELLEGAALSRRSRWPISQRGKGFVSAGEERPCYANPF